MNRTATLFAAAAITVLSNAALAQDAIPATWANEVAKPVTSTVSRAEVRAEMEAARQAGLLNPFDSDLNVRVNAPFSAPTLLARTQQGADRVAALSRNAAATSELSREQVRAEVIAAHKSGEINTFDNLAYLSAPAKSVRVAPAALAQAPQR
jgi:DNA-binding transcriptional regulator YdaS (Cro superfamily)